MVNKKQKSRKIALILACIPYTGLFGVHRFYLGYIGIGLLQVFTFGGVMIWWIYDIVKLARGEMKDYWGQPLKSSTESDNIDTLQIYSDENYNDTSVKKTSFSYKMIPFALRIIVVLILFVSLMIPFGIIFGIDIVIATTAGVVLIPLGMYLFFVLGLNYYKGRKIAKFIGITVASLLCLYLSVVIIFFAGVEPIQYRNAFASVFRSSIANNQPPEDFASRGSNIAWYDATKDRFERPTYLPRGRTASTPEEAGVVVILLRTRTERTGTYTSGAGAYTRFYDFRFIDAQTWETIAEITRSGSPPPQTISSTKKRGIGGGLAIIETRNWIESIVNNWYSDGV